jgi:hypothetical protein
MAENTQSDGVVVATRTLLGSCRSGRHHRSNGVRKLGPGSLHVSEWSPQLWRSWPASTPAPPQPERRPRQDHRAPIDSTPGRRGGALAKALSAARQRGGTFGSTHSCRRGAPAQSGDSDIPIARRVRPAPAAASLAVHPAMQRTAAARPTSARAALASGLLINRRPPPPRRAQADVLPCARRQRHIWAKGSNGRRGVRRSRGAEQIPAGTDALADVRQHARQPSVRGSLRARRAVQVLLALSSPRQSIARTMAMAVALEGHAAAVRGCSGELGVASSQVACNAAAPHGHSAVFYEASKLPQEFCAEDVGARTGYESLRMHGAAPPSMPPPQS